MIRIHYQDFSAGAHEVPGLYGRVESRTRGVTLCLIPGLTAQQRKAVLRRLRQEASRGFGPALPAPQLTVALGIDRVSAAVGMLRAMVRLHPAVTLLPGVFLVALVTMFVLAAGGQRGVVPGTRRGFADAATSASVTGALGPGHGPLRVPRLAMAGKAGR
ncbi:MAG: hypothetical protein ACRDNS_31830 [Trebonia sp.]